LTLLTGILEGRVLNLGRKMNRFDRVKIGKAFPLQVCTGPLYPQEGFLVLISVRAHALITVSKFFDRRRFLGI
jgi:hypothetical protein